MTKDEFKHNASTMIDFIADYIYNIEQYDVAPRIKPGDIKKQLPLDAPNVPETFDKILNDFEKIILPGITHWQHPQFFAYFPTGASEISLLAEMLSTSLGVQCMVWLTSPAAEELEDRVTTWLRNAIGIPSDFTGVIQDSSSTSTLISLLTARESKSDWCINQSGFTGNEKYRIYTSSQGHSSIDKAVRIIGVGIDNLIKIDVNVDFSMDTQKLQDAIINDITEGFIPLCVVSTLGTTSSTAIDNIEEIGKICKKFGIWHHIDASYAGSALILDEYKWMLNGIENADSFVFNPHKWFFTHFDCSVYFVKDVKALKRTFSIIPEYLKTAQDEQVNNYRDWGIALGRRFRALKLWFVIRYYGLDELKNKLRNHIEWSRDLYQIIMNDNDFEIMAPLNFNLICFRYVPTSSMNQDEINQLNEQLIKTLNDSGKIFLTQTKLNNDVVLRIVAGQLHLEKNDLLKGWAFIKQTVATIG